MGRSNGGRSDDAPVAGGGEEDHVLQPLEFDRPSMAYYGACLCGKRFGPLPTALAVNLAFERHRAAFT